MKKVALLLIGLVMALMSSVALAGDTKPDFHKYPGVMEAITYVLKHGGKMYPADSIESKLCFSFARSVVVGGGFEDTFTYDSRALAFGPSLDVRHVLVPIMMDFPDMDTDHTSDAEVIFTSKEHDLLMIFFPYKADLSNNPNDACFILVKRRR